MSNVIKQLGGGGSGQSFKDRMTAAKYTVSGEGLARTVCKASTEQIAAPKKKHVDYLVQCTNEPHVSIPKMADLLISRIQHHNWVTVYKALITMHQIMNYGNERFIQYLASNNCTLSLPNFFDKNTVQGYDMSNFVRRYSKYVHEKTVSYRSMAFDFCKVKRGKEDGMLRQMAIDRLLKTVPVLQSQIDVLLEFDATATDLHNGVINASFLFLFKDLIRLFACYNDAMINLLEKYFELPRKQCREALDMYKRFLVRMDKVGQFLRVAEAIGIDKGEIPDLTRAPASLLEALESHMAELDGGAPLAHSSSSSKLTSAVATAGTSVAKPLNAANGDDERRRILDEEARRIEAFEKAKSRTSTSAAPAKAPAPATNPFDLFGATPPQPVAQQPASVDQLFDLQVAPQPSQPAGVNPFLSLAGAQPVLPAANPYLFTSNSAASAWPAASNAFTPTLNFDTAFGGTPTSNGSAAAFGGVLQPTANANATAARGSLSSNATAAQQSLVTKDIDSSIASLAGNLTISGGYKKPDFSGGSATQQKQPIASLITSNAATTTHYMNSPPPTQASPFNASWNPNGGGILQPQSVAPQPSTNAILQNQLPQLYAFRPGMPVNAAYAMAPAPLQYPGMAMPTQQVQWSFGQAAPANQQPNDPFGAL